MAKQIQKSFGGVRRFNYQKFSKAMEAMKMNSAELSQAVAHLKLRYDDNPVFVFGSDLSRWKASPQMANPREDKLAAVCAVLGCSWEDISEELILTNGGGK